MDDDHDAFMHDLKEIQNSAEELSRVTSSHDTNIRAMHVPETLNLVAKLCATLRRHLDPGA